MAKKRAGIGLTGIVVLGTVLYFSGAGSWFMARVRDLDTSCYELLSNIGTSVGTPVCDGMARGTDWIMHRGEQAVDWIGAQFSGSQRAAQLEEYSQTLLARIREDSPLARLVRPGEELEAIMQSRPELQDIGARARDKMHSAVNQFVIGQHYLQQHATGEAMPWLQHSAAQPDGYGVLSQLTLGDIYRTGDGIEQNPTLARRYYEQAKASLVTLQQSAAPEARQMLQSLPADAQTLSQQLDQRIDTLR